MLGRAQLVVGYLRTVANQASLELSELLFMKAWGCGSDKLFATIKEACRELHPLSTLININYTVKHYIIQVKN
jgi:hypothetical protein